MNTPLRNSKGARKPFRSPFSNAGKSQTSATGSKSGRSKCASQEPSAKKVRVDEEIGELSAGEAKVDVDLSRLTRADLEAKRQKVKNMEKTVNELRTKLRYYENTKAESLEEDIKKWREVCQMALERLLRETREHDQSCTMSQLLSSLGIPQTLVKYSVENDDFVE